RFHREFSLTKGTTGVSILVGRARTQPHCATTIAARRMDPSWALARRMTGSPPTPYCSAANSNECSLTSLGKLRLTALPAPAQEPSPQVVLFGRGKPAPRPNPHAVGPPPSPLNDRPYNRRFFFRAFGGIEGGEAGCDHQGEPARLAHNKTHRRYARCARHR